jgi:preprotein translocase subunit SecA
MDYLKEGIGLRAMAQRDPLIEYQREGYQLFQAMTDGIKDEAVGFLFNLEVKVAEPAEGQTDGTVVPAEGEPASSDGAAPVLVAKGIDGPERQVPLQYSAPSEDGDGGTVVSRGGRSAASNGSAGTTTSAGSDAADSGASNREARRKAARKQQRR